MNSITFANGTVVTPIIDGKEFKGLGKIEVGDTPLRPPQQTFLPWFDTFDGIIFDRFRFDAIETSDSGAVIHLTALGRNDFPFQERRDMSGDICLRAVNWDAPPVEGKIDIKLEPVTDTVDGIQFNGFRYHYEYKSGPKIHRILDRQTWAPGGTLDDHQICCRNWTGFPRAKIGVDNGYSTAGMDVSREALAKVNPMPGNLWARWSLLPGFDMVYNRAGILLAWYDQVTLIRSVIETLPDEDSLRIVDCHYFEASNCVSTNPKTVAWASKDLDDIDAINLWTRMTDRDREISQKQLGIKNDGPPRIEYSKNVWVGFQFESSYEDIVDTAADLGAEVVFIDPIWEHAEAFNREVRKFVNPEDLEGSILDKRCGQSMCCTMDFKVAEVLGGEDGLKKLCDRAKAKGVDILSWMASHMSPVSNFRENSHPELGHGSFGIFAARESGRHPDTGYAGDCWALNLNAPIRDYVRNQILGVCERTGLAGFLWDSFSNLGWWQVDYSDGSMRPQFDHMGQLYADLSNAGLYLMPEAIVAFSNHSCLCLLNSGMVEGDLEAFMYNTVIALPHTLDGSEEALDKKILRGEEPIDGLFRAFSHKWSPNSEMWQVPIEKRDPDAVKAIRELYATYKKVRPFMQKRTVLKNGHGVLWQSEDGTRVLWCHSPHYVENAEKIVDVMTDTPAPGNNARANRVYFV